MSSAANTPSAQSSTPQQQPTPPTSGSATPQPAPAAAAGRSAANVKSFGPSVHGKSGSVNGARPIAPAVPALAGPTIINGNAGVSSPTTTHSNNHARKPSVTISAAGTSGQMPNGGPVAGQTPTGSQIQFGSISAPNANIMASQDASSLSVGTPGANPRIASPSSSPSPIPQPAVPSGGRPPSSLHGPTNSLSFGTFGAENSERRPSIPGQAGTPVQQNAQLRRESNSQHPDMNMGPGAGRGYNQGGRGRGGFNNNFAGPNSPQTRFSTVPPNGPRAPGPNMPQQYAAQRGPGYPQGAPSPLIPGRSPHLAHAQPYQQQGQMPMQSPGIPPNYYPQQGGHNVKPPFSSSLKPKKWDQNQKKGRPKNGDFRWPNQTATSSSNPTMDGSPLLALPMHMFHSSPPFPTNIRPEHCDFEQVVNKVKQMQGYNGYDNYNYNQQYNMPPMYMQQGGGYNMGPNPNAPRPPYQGQNSGYGPQGQYPQPQPMSRQGSTVSTDRPSSTLGQPPPQSPMTPGVSHQHNASRGANSPGPKSSAFQIPGKKASSAIKITNPNTGEALKFDKTPASPAPSVTSKAPESAPTPPPRTPSSQHNRTDSKTAKSSEEVKNDLKQQIQAKLKADQEAAQKVKDDEEAKKLKEQQDIENAAREKAEAEEAARKAEEEKKAQAERAAKEAEEARLSQEKALEAEKAKAAQEEAAAKKIEEEKARVAAAAAAEKEKPAAPAAKAADDENLPKAPDFPANDADDATWDKYEADQAAYEEAMEAAYAKKKAAKKAAEAKAEAEKLARLDEDLKKQEAEAERLEAEKERKRAAGETEDADAFAGLKKSDHAFRATETATDALPEHGSGTNTPSGADTPKSDTSSMPPPPSRLGSKPKPAALKLETQKEVEAAQPSAALQSLRSARKLAHVSPNLYPEGVASPNPALNTNTNAKGSFRYDKDFLMQFQKVFTEKPSETWSEKLKETVGDTDNPPGSARPRGSGATTRTPVGGRGGNAFGGGVFGTFSTGSTSQRGPLQPGNVGDSKSRFENSLGGGGRQPSNPIRFHPGGSNSIGSFSNPGSSRHPSNMARGPSNQGSRAGGGSRGGRAQGGQGGKKADSSMPLTAGMDLKPIEVSASGWKPQSVGRNNASGPPPGGDNGYLAPDVVQRKVKSALNKMTPTTFEKIGNQILEIVSQSKKESDGRTLRQVIQLTFEKATDEAHWAEMYAQFCGKMLQAMTSEIRDETIPKDKNGQVISGSTLFRKYLLNRCQQDFEQGWKSKLPDKPAEESGASGEAAMLSEEYYIAAAAKRRGLGLVRFIGELFKLSMLTARIMHMCIQRLVDFDGLPDEAEVESLTNLLRTIGENLDTLDDKSRGMMNAYFDRINTVIKADGLPSRLQFMLLDVVDLRKANWHDKRSKQKGPATLDEIRADAAKAQREAELKSAADQQNRRGGGGGRPGVGRGDARNFSGGGPPPDFQNNRVNSEDLRRLARGGSARSSAAPGAPMGPTSMFNTARGSNKRSSLAPGGIFNRANAEDSAGSSRTATPTRRDEPPKAAANAFSALAGLDANEGNDTTSPPASVAALSPPSQKRSLPDRSKSPEKGDAAGA